MINVRYHDNAICVVKFSRFVGCFGFFTRRFGCRGEHVEYITALYIEGAKHNSRWNVLHNRKHVDKENGFIQTTEWWNCLVFYAFLCLFDKFQVFLPNEAFESYYWSNVINTRKIMLFKINGEIKFYLTPPFNKYPLYIYTPTACPSINSFAT